jgi:REP element-mobilizing transposase RayT
MPRKPRLSYAGAFHHITTRGNNQQRIFLNNYDRKKYLFLLKEGKVKFQFKIHVYVLMRNHTHLIIELSEKATISQIMHWLNTTYTKYFNREHQRKGHLFHDRFHSVLIDKDAYLLEVSRYVHLNPVRAGIVEHPEDYKWSSYLVYIGEKEKEDNLVEKSLILNMISENKDLQVKLYKEFVNEGINKDFRQFREKLYKGLLSPKSVSNSCNSNSYKAVPGTDFKYIGIE